MLYYKVKKYQGKYSDKKYQSHVAFHLAFNPPRVHVEDEYLIYDLLAMISSIGGTLGLCIGFSFTEFTAFILRFIERLLNKMWNN